MGRKPRTRESRDNTVGNASAPAPLSHSLRNRAYANPNLSLNPSLIDTIISNIHIGSSLNDSFLLCGIPKSTYNAWFKLARTEESNREKGSYDTEKEIYLDLYYSCLQAIAAHQQELIAIITDAARYGDWKAASFLLQTIHQERFTITQKVESTSSIDMQQDTNRVEIVITDQTNPNKVADLERKLASEMK